MARKLSEVMLSEGMTMPNNILKNGTIKVRADINKLIDNNSLNSL